LRRRKCSLSVTAAGSHITPTSHGKIECEPSSLVQKNTPSALCVPKKCNLMFSKTRATESGAGGRLHACSRCSRLPQRLGESEPNCFRSEFPKTSTDHGLSIAFVVNRKGQVAP